jgi:ribosomal subunit interface protein
MQITVSGKGIDVGQALTQHVEARLQEGISKYLDRVTQVQVVFSREKHLHRAHISLNLGTHEHWIVTATGDAADVYAAFDQSAERVEKQLRRYKRRLKNHHKLKTADASQALEALSARYYVLQNDHEEEASEHEDAPLIVAEQTAAVESLSVSDAVMRLNLSGANAMLFFNSRHGGVNMVYRREDGHIGWVDPEAQAAPNAKKQASAA